MPYVRSTGDYLATISDIFPQRNGADDDGGVLHLAPDSAERADALLTKPIMPAIDFLVPLPHLS